MLHRRFLVLAMQKDGDEPTETPFWYSAFQAGYSACWIVKSHIKMYHRHPELISRIPSFWSISFSAAVRRGDSVSPVIGLIIDIISYASLCWKGCPRSHRSAILESGLCQRNPWAFYRNMCIVRRSCRDEHSTIECPGTSLLYLASYSIHLSQIWEP